jgi:hypothetical protein
MAFEKRRNTQHQYLYRGVRVGKCVKKVYVGRGPHAAIESEEIVLNRNYREGLRALVKRAREQHDRTAQMAGELNRQIEAGTTRAAAIEPPAEARDQFRQRMATRKPDQPLAPELRQLLDQYPALWLEVGNLAQRNLRAGVRAIAGTDLVLSEALERQIREMRANLSPQASDPLGGLLVDRVIATWLHLQLVEHRAGASTTRGVPQLERLYNTLVCDAQKRHLAAIAALDHHRRRRRDRKLAGVIVEPSG